MRDLIIIGAGGHGKVIADIGEKNGYTEILFLDDNEAITNCGSYSVVGASSDAIRYSDSDFIVGIGNSEIRKRMQGELLEKGLNIVTLVHPKSVAAPDVFLGIGTVIMAGAVINSGAKIGDGCIINTKSVIEHDSIIEDFCHISPGVNIAGGARIGRNTWVGIGTSIIENIQVCENCIIGAGSTVIRDIKDPGVYVGTPVRKIK